MTYTEQCIKLAIEQGYEVKNAWGNSWHDMPIERILLDPLFFQALGCGLGWKEISEKETRMNTVTHKLEEINVCNGTSWEREQHRLLDFINEGHSIEEFFKSVIENK